MFDCPDSSSKQAVPSTKHPRSSATTAAAATPAQQSAGQQAFERHLDEMEDENCVALAVAALGRSKKTQRRRLVLLLGRLGVENMDHVGELLGGGRLGQSIFCGYEPGIGSSRTAVPPAGAPRFKHLLR